MDPNARGLVGPGLALVIGLVVITATTSVSAAPIVRHEATARGGVVTTGNTLGLAGTASGPAATDRVGVFTDATYTLQVSGWGLGTTLDWALASSDAVLDLPAGARVAYAELVWGGSVDATMVGNIDDTITLRTPSGLVHDVAADAETRAPDGGSMRDGGYYGRSADVTTLIEGAGNYRVGAVPATLDVDDASAGWALHVVYLKDDDPIRRLAVFTVMENVSSVPSAEVTGDIDGVCIPQSDGDRDARLAVVAMEGDVDISGETIRFERTAARLGDAGARITGIGTPLTNPLGGHITRGDGTIDTRGTHGNLNHNPDSAVIAGRQGWDVITLDGTDQLAGVSNEAWFRTTAASDQHSLMSAAVQVDMRSPHLVDVAGRVTVVPTNAAPGQTVAVTVQLDNDGDATATGIVFRLAAALPNGVAYVPGTFLYNGAAPLGGPVNDPAALITGVPLPDIGADQAATVTLSLRIDVAPASGTLSVAPVVSYDNFSCPDADTIGPFDPPAATVSVTVCGNGVIEANEVCDDGDTAPLDGCSATCTIEYGWICEGPPAGPSACGATCGDGLVGVGAEVCDDGDREGLDGCSALCTPERGWACGANPTSQGTPADPDSLCAATCGDGIIAIGGETCDDGDDDALDGCSATCAPEPGWTCGANPNGQGTPAAPDSACTSECGDGVIAVGAEACDDDDDDDLDGCSAACAIERGWLCPTEGAACVPGPCGDGVRPLGADADTTCDDGDGDDGDGCSAACVVEAGFDCVHTAIDGDGDPDSACASTCGDGRLAPGPEACDDGNEDGGDGCDADCATESGWVCTATPNATSVCAEDCGDGRIVGDELCDDGNDLARDGCAADCGAVEHGWYCEGVPSVCTTDCGDGLIGADAEVCDDGNDEDGDGCDCASVELGWSCGDPPDEPSVCEPDCGDGYVRGVEGCDDGNVLDDDGCSVDCRVEPGWICREPDVDARSECDRDTDEDGVLDDGDDSGDPLDNPCDEGVTTGCDDNCPDFGNPDQTFPSGDAATFLCPPYRGERTQGGGGGCAGGEPLSYAVLVVLALLLMAMRARPRARTLIVVLAATSSTSSRAQDVDPRLFDHALSPLSLLGVDSSATHGHLRPWGSVLLNIADDELVTRTGPDATDHGPLTDRTTLTLAAGLGLFDRLDLAIGIPIHSTSLGTATAIAPTVAPNRPRLSGGDVGLGDLRLTLRGRILGPRWLEAGFGLALVADLTLPTGTDAPFMSDGGVAFTPRIVADYRDVDGLIIALNVGYRMRPATRVDDLEIGDELRVGLGAEVPLGFYGIAMTAELGLAVGQGDSAYDEGGVAAREVPVEAIGGLRWRSQDGWVLSGAAGSGITEGYGAPDFRFVLGLSYGAPAPRLRAEPMVAGDRLPPDDDWIDAPKSTPPRRSTEPLPTERFDAVTSADLDADSDGVPLPADQCPTEREDVDGFMDSDGCPDPDNDEDGVVDAQDKCLDQKENVNGNADDDGCPDEDLPALASLGPMLVIKDRVNFKSGSAELLDSDKLVLEQVAVLMMSTPEVARFRIEGHTDNMGDREFNVDLAERRAWSVLAYLVESGVARERLFAKGFGPTRPVASNGTDAGRLQNRRVEFHVIKPGEPTEGLIPATTRGGEP